MTRPTLGSGKPVSALVLTFLLFFASGCQEPSASVANTNAMNNQPAASSSANPASDGAKIEGVDANRAFEHVKNVVAFGPRPSGSEAIKKTQSYIIAELKSYGLRVIEDDFRGATPKGAIPMKNIIAELPGQRPEVVIISGHYDTKILANFVGANDGGSSTAAVLETARVMAKTKPEYTLWFVFFDGEEAVVEWSGTDNTYGSRHMVERMKKDGSLARVKAMILYDMIGDKGLDLRRDETSTRWLVDVIWKTGQRLGYGRNFVDEPAYIADDHVPFIEANVPAVDLIDFHFGGADNRYWHTTQDTLDKVSGESIKIVCDVVITSLPEIFKQLNNRSGSAQSK